MYKRIINSLATLAYEPLLLKKVLLLTLGVITILYGALFAPTYPFSIDGVMYGAAIERFAEGAHLNVLNGYSDHPSPTLQVMFLVPSENGLAFQYPSGFAMLAAPFFLLAGDQGVLLINTLAGIAILALTYLLGRELSKDENLALNATLILAFSTFLVDYTFAIWPHALSALFVVLGAYLAVLSTTSENWAKRISFAGLAGLIIGLGINIRVDVILAAPAIAVWLVGSSRSPMIKVTTFILSLTPGLLAAGYLNLLKFGLFKPFTYGKELLTSEETLDSILAYAGLLPLMPFAVVLVVCLAFPTFRNFFLGLKGALLSFAIITVLVILPFTRDIIFQISRGLYVLLIDIQSYDYIDRQTGVIRFDGKWLIFFGNVKKAMFESLPFAGFLLLPVARLFQSENRSSYALCCVIPLAWFTFYGYSQWHGGGGTNMRYFLPTLPFICILAAFAWKELRPKWKVSTPRSFRGTMIFSIIVIALSIFLFFQETFLPFFFLIGGGMIFFYIAASISVIWIIFPKIHSQLRLTASVTFVGCLVIAFWGAYLTDFNSSQARRYQDALENQMYFYDFIEPNALVISLKVTPLRFHLLRPDGLLARGKDVGTSIDFKLIDWALAQGRPVYLNGDLKQEFEKSPVSNHYSIAPVEHTLNEAMYKLTYSLKGRPWIGKKNVSRSTSLKLI